MTETMLDPRIVTLEFDFKDGKMRAITPWVNPHDFALIFVSQNPHARVPYTEASKKALELYTEARRTAQPPNKVQSGK